MSTLLLNLPAAAKPTVRIVDREHPDARAVLRHLFGDDFPHVEAIAGRWVVALTARNGSMVFGAETEEQLFGIQRSVVRYDFGLLEIETDHLIDDELEIRLVADAQSNALRIVRCEGHA